MPLDDFFAKKDKKKTKKKQNPQELIDKLTKETEQVADQEAIASVDATKSSIAFGQDDEWEALDDEEKDIDLQTIRIGKLDIATTDEGKQSKEKDKENAADADGEKKVWGAKSSEPPTDEQEEVVTQSEPVVEKPSRYVPVHLRPAGSRTIAAAKPQLDNTAEFPTLDAAAVPEIPTAAKGSDQSEEASGEDSWTKAGAPARKPRDSMPIAISSQSPTPSNYVPPSLRQGASAFGQSSFSPSTFDDTFRRADTSRSVNRNAPNPYDTPGQSNLDGWSRGSTISGSQGAYSRPSYPTQPPKPRIVSSDWSRNVTVKTFNESSKDTPKFELTQSNRFAGLSET